MSPHPTSRVMPHLTVNNAKKALEWYAQALGATELYRADAQDEKRLMHAAMRVNGAVVLLNDDFPEYMGGKSRLPEKIGGSPVSIHLELKSTAALNRRVARAKKAGAVVEMEPADMFWGDRYAVIRDPFGHRWSFGATLGA